MTDPVRPGELLAALDEIIRGVNVRRLRHDLVVDGRDVSALFLARLAARGYTPQSVREVPVADDERAPAFLVEGSVATFGYVFWEKFTETKKRKLFGSAIRDAKGDWAVVLPVGSPRTLYANAALKEKIDPNRPGEF